MLNSVTEFASNLARIDKLDAIYVHLTTIIKIDPIELSDMLRSELMYVVSAFDKLMHDLVRAGMVESFMGLRPKSAPYLKYNLSMEQINNIGNPGFYPPEVLFEQYVRAAHSHLSFQDPIKVSEILALIWSEQHKWQKIANCMSMLEGDVKVQLKNIVIRRNQIVHEADMDLSTGVTQPIIYSDVRQSCVFISKLGNCIYNLIKLP